MRPEDVRRFFTGEVSDEQVRRVLAALRADPDWLVLEPFAAPPEWLFQLVHRPTGKPYGFRATRPDPSTWRFLD